MRETRTGRYPVRPSAIVGAALAVVLAVAVGVLWARWTPTRAT
jgi:hypothetical protein